MMRLNDNKQEEERNIFVMKNYGNCNVQLHFFFILVLLSLSLLLNVMKNKDVKEKEEKLFENFFFHCIFFVKMVKEFLHNFPSRFCSKSFIQLQRMKNISSKHLAIAITCENLFLFLEAQHPGASGFVMFMSSSL